jgi:hypothetical protein
MNDPLFIQGINYVKHIQDMLVPNWIDRAEYLSKPNHRSLAYTRMPDNHLILFDVMTGLFKQRGTRWNAPSFVK